MPRHFALRTSRGSPGAAMKTERMEARERKERYKGGKKGATQIEKREWGTGKREEIEW